MEMNEFRNEKLVYQLYDVQGKLLITNPIKLAITQINMRKASLINFLSISTLNAKKNTKAIWFSLSEKAQFTKLTAFSIKIINGMP